MTTTPDEGTTPAEQPVPPSSETTEPAAEEGAPEGTGREAARYRVRARDAETARDALAERVTTYQRRDVERAASEFLAVGDDVWRFGGDLGDYLDEHGEVDADRVAGAAATILDQRPGLARGATGRHVDLGQGTRQHTETGLTWQGVLKQ